MSEGGVGAAARTVVVDKAKGVGRNVCSGLCGRSLTRVGGREGGEDALGLFAGAGAHAGETKEAKATGMRQEKGMLLKTHGSRAPWHRTKPASPMMHSSSSR